MPLPRRSLLAGLGLTLAAPAIVRTPGLLMPVRRVLLRETLPTRVIYTDNRVYVVPDAPENFHVVNIGREKVTVFAPSGFRGTLNGVSMEGRSRADVWPDERVVPLPGTRPIYPPVRYTST